MVILACCKTILPLPKNRTQNWLRNNRRDSLPKKCGLYSTQLNTQNRWPRLEIHSYRSIDTDRLIITELENSACDSSTRGLVDKATECQCCIQWLKWRIRGVECWLGVRVGPRLRVIVDHRPHGRCFFSGKVCGTPVWMWPMLCSIVLTCVFKCKQWFHLALYIGDTL